MTEVEAREVGGAMRGSLMAQARAFLVSAIGEQPVCMVESHDSAACLQCIAILDCAQQLVSAVAVAQGAHNEEPQPTGQSFDVWLTGLEGALKDVFKK